VPDVEVSLRGRLNHRPRSAPQEDTYHPARTAGKTSLSNRSPT
jgi:hypothetical protein